MIRYTEQAERSVADISVYLGRRGGAEVADRFLESVDASAATLARNPRLAPCMESDNLFIAELRRWPIRGFPNHHIFFRIIPNGIEIVDILHAARDLPRALGEP